MAGFPHYENVASNVLQFFFDCSEEHGFGNLWLRAVLLALLDKIRNLIPSVNNMETIGKPLREYSNGSNDRIDLLIDCGSLIIVIENKIYAEVYNDLPNYIMMAENYARDNKRSNPKIIGVVLSLKKTEIEGNYFCNITYHQLFEKIDLIKHEYQLEGKWDLLQNEFIENIKRMERRRFMKSDTEWNKFAIEHTNDINSLIDKYETEAKERLNFLKTVEDILSESGVLINTLSHGVYNSSSSKYMSHFVDIQYHESRLVIESCLMRKPSDCRFEEYDSLNIFLWCRGNKHFKQYKEVLTKMDLEMIYEDKTRKDDTSKKPGGWGEYYLIERIELTNENLSAEEVAKKIEKYILSVAK